MIDKQEIETIASTRIAVALIILLALSLIIPWAAASVMKERQNAQRQIIEQNDKNHTYADYVNTKGYTCRVKILSVQPGLFTLETADGIKFQTLSGELRYTK